MLKNMHNVLLPIEERRILASIAYGTGRTMLEMQGTIRAIVFAS